MSVTQPTPTDLMLCFSTAWPPHITTSRCATTSLWHNSCKYLVTLVLILRTSCEKALVVVGTSISQKMGFEKKRLVFASFRRNTSATSGWIYIYVIKQGINLMDWNQALIQLSTPYTGFIILKKPAYWIGIGSGSGTAWNCPISTLHHARFVSQQYIYICS